MFVVKKKKRLVAGDNSQEQSRTSSTRLNLPENCHGDDTRQKQYLGSPMVCFTPYCSPFRRKWACKIWNFVGGGEWTDELPQIDGPDGPPPGILLYSENISVSKDRLSVSKQQM